MKQFYIPIAILLVILLMTFAGCQEETPVDILKPDEVAQIIAQRMLQSVQTNESSAPDSILTFLAVLDKNQTTHRIFAKSISYYRGQNNVWLRILEKTATILQEEQDKNAKADSSDIKK